MTTPVNPAAHLSAHPLPVAYWHGTPEQVAYRQRLVDLAHSILEGTEHLAERRINPGDGHLLRSLEDADRAVWATIDLLDAEDD